MPKSPQHRRSNKSDEFADSSSSFWRSRVAILLKRHLCICGNCGICCNTIGNSCQSHCQLSQRIQRNQEEFTTQDFSQFSFLSLSSLLSQVAEMADPQQVALLQQGAEIWNQWRKDHPDVPINLRAVFL